MLINKWDTNLVLNLLAFNEKMLLFFGSLVIFIHFYNFITLICSNSIMSSKFEHLRYFQQRSKFRQFFRIFIDLSKQFFNNVILKNYKNKQKTNKIYQNFFNNDQLHLKIKFLGDSMGWDWKTKLNEYFLAHLRT